VIAIIFAAIIKGVRRGLFIGVDVPEYPVGAYKPHQEPFTIT
jgi:hypothetical protein